VPDPGAAQDAVVRWLDDESVLLDYSDAPPQIVNLDGTTTPLGVDIQTLVAVVEY
jgi:hypothetical protein